MISKITKLALATLFVMGISSAQTITQCTQRALPGDPINIMGDNLTGPVTVQMAQVDSYGDPGAWVITPIIRQGDGILQVNVPTTFTNEVWQLQVISTSNKSLLTYINQPELYFIDANQASPGETINIYGRNFQVLGTSVTGQVKFTDTAGNISWGIITNSTPYCYTVRVPTTAVPGMTYTVQVRNGFSSFRGISNAASLTIQATAADPFNLGNSWGELFTFSNNIYNVKTDSRLALHAVGDGITNDLSAIQAAVTAASKAGGGVVYLPTGSYQIANNTTGLNLASNVVIQGDGQNETTILFGSNWTPANPPNSTIFPIRGVGLSLVGFSNLKIQNQNTSTTPSNTILLSIPSKASDKVFMVNCLVAEVQGLPFILQGATNLLFDNNTFDTLSTISSPLTIIGCSNIKFDSNIIAYRNGRISFQFDSNVIITNNIFKRDNNFMTPTAAETGCIELSCDQNAYVNNNSLIGVGPFPNQAWCGEMINTQRSNCMDEEDLGSVTSATLTTLTNTSANWETAIPFSTPGKGLFNRATVSIVSGKGTGQTRFITSNTATTLTLDKPWLSIPDSTSTYTIGFWAADHLLITNNTISNSVVGIELFEGANSCVIDSNTLINTGKILLRSEDVLHSPMVPASNPMKGCRHEVSWSNWISNNTVTNTSGNIPAAISIYGRDSDGISRGNLVFGTEVRNNTINEHTPNTTYTDESAFWEGFWNFVKVVNGVNDPYANLGTILVGNQGNNVSLPLFNIQGSGLTALVTTSKGISQ